MAESDSLKLTCVYNEDSVFWYILSKCSLISAAQLKTPPHLPGLGPPQKVKCHSLVCTFMGQNVFNDASNYCLIEPSIVLIPGFTLRLPVKLESRMHSALQLSWELNGSSASSNTTLYHSHLDSYSTFSMDTTTNNHYTFTALDACSPYVACVEIADSASLICLSTITGKDQ